MSVSKKIQAEKNIIPGQMSLGLLQLSGRVIANCPGGQHISGRKIDKSARTNVLNYYFVDKINEMKLIHAQLYINFPRKYHSK